MKTLKEIKPDNKKKDNELFWSKLLNLSMAEAIRKKTYKSISPEKVKPKGSAVGSNIYNGVLDVGRDQNKKEK